MDPEVYHNPHDFNPERFLSETGEPYPTGATFGYGRRYVKYTLTMDTILALNCFSSICVGRHLAEANIWIAAASLLAAFDIVRARDEFGQEIVPEVKMIEAIITYGFSPSCALIIPDRARLAILPLLDVSFVRAAARSRRSSRTCRAWVIEGTPLRTAV